MGGVLHVACQPFGSVKQLDPGAKGELNQILARLGGFGARRYLQHIQPEYRLAILRQPLPDIGEAQRLSTLSLDAGDGGGNKEGNRLGTRSDAAITGIDPHLYQRGGITLVDQFQRDLAGGGRIDDPGAGNLDITPGLPRKQESQAPEQTTQHSSLSVPTTEPAHGTALSGNPVNR
ncbi:hypothetical protein D3C80_1588230 [compost metagenome]